LEEQIAIAGAKMLSEGQRNTVWEKMLTAEVRSLYFGDLASRENRRKQLVTGISFFLSSGAAATLAAQMHWLPLVFSIIAAVLMAYSMAVGLDKRATAMAKLHYEWNHLNSDYERLWYHLEDGDAEQTLEELRKRGREASESATELPLDEGLLRK
jgi:hypothetical protein